MRQVLCVCSEMPGLELATSVLVVSHAAEIRTTTGTARLTARALRRCLWEVRGRRGEEAPVPWPAGALLLYPREDARELTPADRGAPLVIPDGTWSQVAKMIRRDKNLRALPAVRLPDGLPSRFYLRERRHPNGLCTFEAAARALGIVEGAAVEAELLAVFEKVVERTLWSRGRLSAEQTRFGIPEAARAFDRLVGARGGRPRLTRVQAAPN